MKSKHMPVYKSTVAFYGWKKYLVIAYNLGVFKMIKWGIVGWLMYRYRHKTWPWIKYGVIITSTTFIVLFWLRFAIYRTFGAATYERNTFKLCRSRFETVFKEYEQLSTPSLIYLVHKTWLKCMVFRNHRKWLRALQGFLDNYKPFKYYTSDEMKHGIAFQPLIIERDGYYKGYFTWFIDRKDMMNTYGWVEIKCDGNYHARTMNVNEFRLHVNPREGGEVLRFNPFRISIDENWNAELLDEFYSFKETEEEHKERKVSQDVPRQKLRSKLKHKSMLSKQKRPAKVSEAEYKIKNDAK